MMTSQSQVQHVAGTSDVYPSRVNTETLLLKRQDPVVYNHMINQAEITAEQLASYEANGYLFLDSFFDEDEVQIWKQELVRLFHENKGSNKPEVIQEPGSEEIRSIFAVHRDKGAFQQLASHPRIVSIVQQILGSQIYVHQSRINFKQGFTGKEFYWHSDFETWHVEDGMPRMRALSCSIALEDNHANNGPLMVIPRSHRTFVSCIGETPDDHYKSSLRRQEYGIPDQDSLICLVNQGGIVAPTGKAGSILLFDCNVMHGSNSNITPFPRSNVFIVYNSVDNRLEAPYSGKQPRPDYIATRS
ncbi:ectoine hydroxylase [Paenibacillus apiarius]|uniref:Ectoine hydroxylase n=2 Tax=Paenibacillus apiarius TaxID=46240 RepID=A0ABT4DT04_9BACL|nr:ectoine hydroxylase [Paenibacillus apiarius]MCY9513826.1 ectoine hydroxylase [Paenibacillus apiarius]MCY9520474.1 ectoine hydroxylase [Paenibacillus apiarius]MCY9550607.1 ectoine hydroxylase [Paenibacillus apiarius]MCY9559128.1 ectoine hydroxylase [Paenibacillus apiarius]MCY9683077.1 ectoine hydroxylase [Paenibacillus apiarius]